MQAQLVKFVWFIMRNGKTNTCLLFIMYHASILNPFPHKHPISLDVALYRRALDQLLPIHHGSG